MNEVQYERMQEEIEIGKVYNKVLAELKEGDYWQGWTGEPS